MDNPQIAMNLLTEVGALLTGHFRLTSGLHAGQYMQCARLFQYADKASVLCKILADSFAKESIDVVAGPAVGAVQMAFEVSRHLGVKNIFAERVDGTLAFRRGFSLEPGARVLVVEDTVTTGGTVRELMNVVQSLGGVVAGVGAIVDRSGGQTQFGVPFRAAVTLSIPVYDPDDCPLCREGLAIVKPGSRQ